MAGLVLLVVGLLLIGLAASLHGGVGALPAVLFVAAIIAGFYLVRHTRRRRT